MISNHVRIVFHFARARVSSCMHAYVDTCYIVISLIVFFIIVMQRKSDLKIVILLIITTVFLLQK